MKYKIVREKRTDNGNLLDIPEEQLVRIPYVYLHRKLEDKAFEFGTFG